MTSKERMMMAVNREKPDRLPVTIHQWQPYHLKKYLGGVSDIEANKICGLDAAITYIRMIPEEFPQWKVAGELVKSGDYDVTKYTIETPGGILTMSEGTNIMTSWVVEGLIKKEEDIQLIRKYFPVPTLDKADIIRKYDELGDAGILRCLIIGKQGGCWQDACDLFGTEELILATYDDPDWVKEFLDILLEKKLEYIEKNLRGAKFDLVETGGGASSNTVISPAIHREFCLPYDQKIHDAIHDAGHKVVYHTCGGMTKITDCIRENHCDVSETLSPTGVGGDIGTQEDADKLYQELHPTLGLIGGMDQFNMLEKGTKQQIETEVDRLFHTFGEDGGYIMSGSDHFFEAPVDNLKAFAEAAKKYTY